MLSQALMRCVEAGIPVGERGVLAHLHRKDPQSGAGNCICGRHEGHQLHQADAEQAKQTGGMVALYPRQDFAEMLVIPGGEPIEDLHVTLVFLGDDSSMIDPGTLTHAVARVVDQYPAPITARIFGHAVFNPDGHEGRDPCGVYLVGHSQELAQLHSDLIDATVGQGFPLPEQHEPWLPHITAGYSSQAAITPQGDGGPEVGEYTGEVIFDRVGVAMAGQTQFFLFDGSHPAERAAYREVHWPYL